MASHTINGQAWPSGTVVSVYPGEAQPAGQDTVPAGLAVTTGTVVGASVTFSGLTEGRRYVAYASGVVRRFLVQPGSVDTLRPITGSEAQDIRDQLDAVELEQPEIVVDPTATSGTVVQQSITLLAGTGGIVTLKHGDHGWNTTPAFPPNLTKKILVRGAAGARIVFSGSTERAFDCTKNADHDVIQNIEISDLIVDNNNVVGTARHVLFGNKPSAVATGRLSFADITIRRCQVLNLVTDKTSVAAHWAVLITPTQAAAGEVTQTYAKRILVEELDVFNGNAAVNVVGSVTGPGVAGYNTYLDDITIRKCRHFQSAIVGRGALDGTAVWGASFQVGSRAYGGKVTVKDCYSYGIGDVAFEMNSCRDMLIENCVAEEAAGYAFYHTNFNYPDTIVAGPPATPSPEQKVTWRGCKYRKTASESYGAAFQVNTNLTIPVGTVVYEDCSVYVKKPATITDWQIAAGDFVGVSAIFNEIRIDGFKGVIEGVNYNQAGADTMSLMSFVVQTPGNGRIRIRRTELTMTGDAPGAGLIGINGIVVQGVGGKLDFDGIDWNLNVTNNPLSGSNIISLGGVAGNTVEGSIRRVRVISNIDGGRGITVRGTGLLTIPTELTVENCDFTNNPGGGLPDLFLVVDTLSNGHKVRPINNQWKSYNQSRQAVAASTTIDTLPDLVAVTSTTAPRTLTLPLAAAYPPGRVLRIKDESGGAAANNITVARAGADTIDGAVSVVINTNYGSTRLYSTGSAWAVV